MTAVNEDISAHALKLLQGNKSTISRLAVFPSELASRDPLYEAGGNLTSIVSLLTYLLQ